MALHRLDKILSQSGERTRSEAGKLIRAGLVSVDGASVMDPAYKADASICAVAFRGERISDQPFQYAMLHKPAGVLTAARDPRTPTVMGLLPERMRSRGVMPVGRLDKDTTGLLLLTSDGTLAHRLLSPKNHVWKEYRAAVDGPLAPAHAEAFARGIPLSDFTAKPAELEILNASAEESLAVVRLREGKNHQVKRMFAALGLRVTSLHRQAFGPLRLDIPPGEYRALSDREIEALYAAVRMDGDSGHG
jgi:16S rRNA pseudouridine516 synthase